MPTAQNCALCLKPIGFGWPTCSILTCPQAHWTHLRTGNVVESPFAALRLHTNAAKRFKKVENATALIWKMLLISERRFRKLDSPELVQVVWEGVRYADGRRLGEDGRKDATSPFYTPFDVTFVAFCV